MLPLYLANGTGASTGKGQLIQLQELTQGRIIAFGHPLHRPEIECSSFMQEEHAIGELLREAHVMGDDDAGEFQLELELLDEVAEKLRHQRIDQIGRASCRERV